MMDAVWLEDAENFETIVFESTAESFERTELCYCGVEVDMFELRGACGICGLTVLSRIVDSRDVETIQACGKHS